MSKIAQKTLYYWNFSVMVFIGGLHKDYKSREEFLA
jgi:hypothetical protein